MTYLVLKALHIISVIAWMAGLFYLPRLFVYHADAIPGGEASETFKVMERRLRRAIMLPAAVASWLFGLATAWAAGFMALLSAPWFVLKLVLAVVLTAYHMWLARLARDFAGDTNTRPARFFRIINEVPTLIMVLIVLLVILRPF